MAWVLQTGKLTLSYCLRALLVVTFTNNSNNNNSNSIYSYNGNCKNKHDSKMTLASIIIAMIMLP